MGNENNQELSRSEQTDAITSLLTGLPPEEIKNHKKPVDPQPVNTKTLGADNNDFNQSAEGASDWAENEKALDSSFEGNTQNREVPPIPQPQEFLSATPEQLASAEETIQFELQNLQQDYQEGLISPEEYQAEMMELGAITQQVLAAQGLQAKQQQAMQQKVAEEFTALQHKIGSASPEQAKQKLSAAKDLLLQEGFNQQEVSSINDHRTAALVIELAELREFKEKTLNRQRKQQRKARQEKKYAKNNTGSKSTQSKSGQLDAIADLLLGM